MSAPLTIGSLFAGIGGLELGLERGIGNGAHTVWQVEQNEYCRAVLAKHWPDATRYEDVRHVGRSNLAPVDVLCGGFPCQPISHNGHGLTDQDERWLWPEFARIIGELRPRYVVMENVAALTGRGLSDICGDLAAFGYDAEWTCLRASDVGAPHRRERLFLVAYPECVGREAGPRILGGLAAQDIRRTARWSGVPHRNADGRVRLMPHADVLRVADGFPTELDFAGLTAYGNAVVPQVAEVVGWLIAEREADLARTRGAA